MRSWALLVFAASLALDLSAAPSGIPGSLFMQGRDVDAVPVTLARYHGRRVRIFDRQIAYRNDRKACVRFELPQELPLSGTSLRLEVEAYNDDPSYLRGLWFEVDGIGGYLAVQRVAKGQYLGEGTIGPGERKRWVLPLNRLELSLDGKASSAVDFDTVFRQSGLHTVCAWISTYAKYGPESWITLDLVGSPEGWDADDSPGRGSNPPVGSRTRSEADTAGPELAGVRANRGQPAGADPCADKTLLLPERGMVAYRKGDYPRAVEWFDRAAAVTPPDYLYPHTNLAGALTLAGQTEAALAQLRQACARAPAFTRSRMLRDADFGGLRAASQFSDILDGPCAVEAGTGAQLSP